MSDAQYVIDVAATFKGEQTIAQMDALTAKLLGAGAGADSFQNAVVQLSNALDQAKESSAAANSALAAGNAEYKALEQAANQAAKAQEKAGRLGVIPPEVAASASAAAAALELHVTELAKLEQAAAIASQREDALGVSMANVRKLSTATAAAEKKAADEVKAATDEERAALQETINTEAAHDRALKKTAGALSSLGGPFGAVGAWTLNAVDDFGDMAKTMGTTGASAVIAGTAIASVALAIAAVVAAVVVGTIAIASWAVGLGDARRSAGLATEAFEAMNPGVEALHETIDGLTSRTGLSEAALDGIAKSLIAAKVSAADLPDALTAAALAERALGNGGAAEFTASLKDSKKSVAALSTEVQAKLGGVVTQQMRSLSAQSDRFHASVSQLFGGLNIDPVLSGFEKLVGLFDENSAAGQALQLIFESVFQPLINQADAASTAIEAFALGFLIGLTKVYIAVKPAIHAVSEFFGTNDSSLSDTMATVTKAGEYLVPVFVAAAAVLAVLAVSIGLAVAAIVVVQVAIYAVGAAVIAAGAAIIYGFVSAWDTVTSFLDSITLEGVGTAIMQGLANGITAAAGIPLAAITGVVNGAISGAKSVLGIHSPSTVFAEIGDNTAAGFAGGVADATPDVRSSLERMVDPPAPTTQAGSATGARAGGGAAAASSGGSNFAGAVFNFYGVENAEDAEARFGEIVTRLWEGDAASIGGASVPT